MKQHRYYKRAALMLMTAALFGHVEMVNLLFQQGISMEVGLFGVLKTILKPEICEILLKGQQPVETPTMLRSSFFPEQPTQQDQCGVARQPIKK